MATLDVMQFIYGAVMMNFLIGALYFWRFWQRTKDRFFALFSGAFLLMSVERWFLFFINVQNEAHTWVFMIRMVAFLLIIGAVVDKNRAQKNYTPR